MKLRILATLAATCGLSYGAVIIGGGISNAQDNTGADLPGGTTALLLIDLDGSGPNLNLDPFDVGEGDLLAGDYVAAVGTSQAVFGTSSITLQSPSIALGASTGVNTGQSYYMLWLPGKTDAVKGTGDAGGSYVVGSEASWVVPGDGGTATPPSGAPPFQVGAVVPEPTSALLLGLASLAFLRRRR